MTTTITDGVNPKDIEKNWDKIREIIASVPSYDEIYAATQSFLQTEIATILSIQARKIVNAFSSNT